MSVDHAGLSGERAHASGHLPVERVADDRTMLTIARAGALAQLSEPEVVGYGCVPERAKVPVRPSCVAYPSSIGH